MFETSGTPAISYEWVVFIEYLYSYLAFEKAKKKKKKEEEEERIAVASRRRSFPVYRKAWARLAAHTSLRPRTPAHLLLELLIEPRK
jgi:hypothetical protein